MSKSMYSLILSDEIIERIDSMAKLQNMSRSGLINQILAQYVSVVTPEQRMQSLYSLMHSHMQSLQDEFRFILGQSERDFTAVSALKYKYNPTIRYNVTLYRDGGEHIGEMKAILRTQNAALLQKYEYFVKLWTAIEESEREKSVTARLGGGIYRRLLCKPQEDISPERLSKSITDYIALFNECVKLYLSANDDTETVSERIIQLYWDYSKGGVLL